jgi:hypothetical protein
MEHPRRLLRPRPIHTVNQSSTGDPLPLRYTSMSVPKGQDTSFRHLSSKRYIVQGIKNTRRNVHGHIVRGYIIPSPRKCTAVDCLLAKVSGPQKSSANRKSGNLRSKKSRLGSFRKCGNLWYQSILQFAIFGTNY